MNENALIAMSGGVDSSVAAWMMLQHGYCCIGITMKLIADDVAVYFPENSFSCSSRTCCSLEDTEDARSVCFRLGIPYHVYNFSREFRTYVVEPFIAAYEHGLTPNPCIACNRYLKFDRLFRTARELGCDTIVTGHYARIEQLGTRYVLKKAADQQKDQSYVLYHMTQEQLRHTCFPLGTMHKEDVRRIASAQGFQNADKPDSQDICFVPDGDYAGFMERWNKVPYPEGDFLDLKGCRIGRHKGAVRYTIGQRKGLGMGFGSPMYVCRKDMEHNTVTLGPAEQLFRREVWADNLNWILFPQLDAPLRVKAKVRYRQAELSAWIYPESTACSQAVDSSLPDAAAGSVSAVRVVFDEPQRAPAPGQAIVFYDGELVVGGGTIMASDDETPKLKQNPGPNISGMQ